LQAWSLENKEGRRNRDKPGLLSYMQYLRNPGARVQEGEERKKEKGVDDNRVLSTWKSFAPPIAATGRLYLKAGGWV
jgi:hypothetical protein